jgi:RHS repeat-associated protein
MNSFHALSPSPTPLKPIKNPRDRYSMAASTRAIAMLMLSLQIWLATPLSSIAIEATPGRPSAARAVAPSPPIVHVNRTVPNSAPPPDVHPRFSANPTETEFLRAALFEEPLVPVGRPPSAQENKSLAAALTDYANRSSFDDTSALSDFLHRDADSPWRVALLVTLGIIHYRACRFSQTFPVWEEAWRLGKGSTEPKAKALVDRALGELARMHARVGHMGQLEALFKEIGNRQLVGSAAEIISNARKGLWRMNHEPWVAFRCGPLALNRIMAFRDPAYSVKDCIYYSRSTTNGFSLQQLHELSKELGLKMLPAKRNPEAPILAPAVIHWKVGHYAALLKAQGGKFLIEDPTFGPELWIDQETLEREGSGYFLVEQGTLPQGWKPLDVSDASSIFGKGDAGNNDEGKPQKHRQRCEPMTTASFDPLTVSLFLSDTPVRYFPPRGPAIAFDVSYLHREGSQPANFTFANFGPKWTFEWNSYVIDDPSNPSAQVSVYLPGGGADFFRNFNSTNNTFDPEPTKRTVLTRVSTTNYTMRFPDGSQHIFSRPAGISAPRRVFLTQILDPAGNTVDLAYDGSNRLTAIRDSIGQVSTIGYTQPGDIYKVTRISDPFGRFASFSYDSAGRLTNITDVIGIQSSFTYDGPTDFVTALTTPYGTSRFSRGENGTQSWLELTDPQNATERVEFRNTARGIPFVDATGVPISMSAYNLYVWSRNTFYWSKKAYKDGAGDYTKAKIYHWLHGETLANASSILESEKQPLENRVWYNYPNQTWAGGVNVGMIGKPSKVGRILDDGASQIFQYEYNALGKVTKKVDPLGRTTVYKYATNRIDLVEVRQTAGVDDLLETRTYNSQHLPLTIANGSGNTNRFIYNSYGQILTNTNPRDETTAYNYDTNGYLRTIDPPLPGTNDSTFFSYDIYGRLRTLTDSEGYTLTYDYDALDRLTRTTYPDGTFEEHIYERLDRIASRNRNGQATQYGYDANRHLTSVEDPLHRVTRYEWCSCGQMEALTDAMGRQTTWDRDIQGRVIAKRYVDASQVTYAYEGTTSRLKSVTDEKGQVKVYNYYPDNNIRELNYLNPENPTPRVSFTYDAAYNRVKTMADGVGLTTFGYYPASVNDGRLAVVNGPLLNDRITYDYDSLGRIQLRAISNISQLWQHDSLGRVSAITNILGTFTNEYVGATARPANTIYSNGQRTDYDYYDNVGDRRLREMRHKRPANQNLSRFAYAYDPIGQITNWVQEIGTAPPESWAVSYDFAQQLNAVTITTNSVVKRSYVYDYDRVGNRLFEEINGQRHGFSYNALNQIGSSDDTTLRSRSYKWDAENRLVGIKEGSEYYSLSYDGRGNLARMQEWNGTNFVSDIRYLWCDEEICEARDEISTTRTTQYFFHGQSIGKANVYYCRDHLGSVRNVADTTGTSLSSVTYEPFGSSVRIDGANVSEKGFTGHYINSKIGLIMAPRRVYDSTLGRWLSRDFYPNAELLPEGPNLYSYVGNDPINLIDPSGHYLLGCVVLVATGIAGGYILWQVNHRGIPGSSQTEDETLICQDKDYGRDDPKCPQTTTTTTQPK